MIALLTQAPAAGSAEFFYQLVFPRSLAEGSGLLLYLLNPTSAPLRAAFGLDWVPQGWGESVPWLVLACLAVGAWVWWGRRRRFGWLRKGLLGLLAAGLLAAVLVNSANRVPYHRLVGILPYQPAPGSPPDDTVNLTPMIGYTQP